MKKLITLLLLFTLVGFLSGNQVIITNNYQYIITTEATYNFSNGTPSNNVKYDRTNKIQIQNNKVIANPLNYHYAFFWDEANAFIGYYKTNKGIATNGAYLGQVNTQSIPLPLNAYSFALVRYDNDYVLVNGFTIEELFIDNNLANVDPDDFNDIAIAELNNNSLNDIFNRTILKTTTALPNGVKYYEISGGNIVQRVQQKTLIASDIAIFANGTNLQRIGINFPSFPGIIAQTSALNLSTFVGGLLNEVPESGFDTIGNADKWLTSNISLYILKALGTYANLAAAQTGLAGTQILYQLATPITILSGVSINQAALDTYYQIWLNGLNATYYATDGNVSSVDGHYYAAGKNIFNNQFNSSLGASRVESTQLDTYIWDFRMFGFTTLKAIETEFKPLTRYTFTGSSIIGPNAAGGSAMRLRVEYTDGTGANMFNPTATLTTFTYISDAGKTIDRINFAASNVNGNFRLHNFQIEQGTVGTSYEAFATPTTTLNLTFLFGVGNEPNKATMDGYYQDYEDWQDYSFILPLAFNTQTISFETIYFDDGVSTEIERLGSILIFTLIGFTLMIFGFASKRRIFNLLAVGAFVVLGFLLIEFVGFIIILFGLIFVNVYYTFFGEL
jgi:hypothetical protein